MQIIITVIAVNTILTITCADPIPLSSRRAAKAGRNHWNKTNHVQRWNSRTAFLVTVSAHTLEASQTRVFYPPFSVLKNAIHE
jgi:hypothetical protein